MANIKELKETLRKEFVDYMEEEKTIIGNIKVDREMYYKNFDCTIYDQEGYKELLRDLYKTDDDNFIDAIKEYQSIRELYLDPVNNLGIEKVIQDIIDEVKYRSVHLFNYEYGEIEYLLISGITINIEDIWYEDEGFVVNYNIYVRYNELFDFLYKVLMNDGEDVDLDILINECDTFIRDIADAFENHIEDFIQEMSVEIPFVSDSEIKEYIDKYMDIKEALVEAIDELNNEIITLQKNKEMVNNFIEQMA